MKTQPIPLIVIDRGNTYYFLSIKECAERFGISRQRVMRAFRSPDGEMIIDGHHYWVDEMLPSTLEYILQWRDAFSP